MKENIMKKKSIVKNSVYDEKNKKEQNALLDIINLTKRGFIKWFVQKKPYENLIPDKILKADIASFVLNSMLSNHCSFIADLPFGEYVVITQSVCATHSWNSFEIYDNNGKTKLHYTEMQWDAGKEFWHLTDIIRKQILERNTCVPFVEQDKIEKKSKETLYT